MNDDTLRDYLNECECTGPRCDHETADRHYLVSDDILKALRDRLLAAIPVVTMNELLDAKQLPKKVATYKKMVWMQNYYRDKCIAVIASVLNDKEK